MVSSRFLCEASSEMELPYTEVGKIIEKTEEITEFSLGNAVLRCQLDIQVEISRR